MTRPFILLLWLATVMLQQAAVQRNKQVAARWKAVAQFQLSVMEKQDRTLATLKTRLHSCETEDDYPSVPSGEQLGL